MIHQLYQADYCWDLLFTSAAAIVERSAAVAVTDYFVCNISNVLCCAEQNVDRCVTLHVRDIVLARGEGTVAQSPPFHPLPRLFRLRCLC
jgi:hypothetical protein